MAQVGEQYGYEAGNVLVTWKLHPLRAHSGP